MSKTIIPAGYKPTLGLYETQAAIGELKRIFEDALSNVLRLKRVSAHSADAKQQHGLIF